MAEAALKTVLAVDVGGTNTSLDLVDVSTSEYRKISSRKLSSHSIIEFPEAVKSTLQDMLSHSPEARPQAACFSVAGPVQGRSCKPTNLHWFVDADLLETSLGFPCSIINDFSAICYAVPLIDPNDTNLLLTIPHTDGSSGIREGSVSAAVGAGTGLGVGFLIETGNGHIVLPSEGGHSAVPAFDSETAELKDFLSDWYGGTVGAEPFISGRGIAHIYRFYLATGRIKTREMKELETTSDNDLPERISQLAAGNGKKRTGNKEAQAVMRRFVTIYARFAGNTALFFLPRKGLYLAGGIVSKNEKHFLHNQTFMRSFEENYRENIRHILKRIPVYIIRDYGISTIGAAHAAVLSVHKNAAGPSQED